MIADTPLARTSVSDAMNTGILMTDPNTPLELVARLMAQRGVHVVAIADSGEVRRPLSVVTTFDVTMAVASSTSDQLTAGQAGQNEVVTVRSDDTIENAAGIMVENHTEHLLVLDPSSGHAEGILSSLDVAAVLGR
jgi:CBS domain-containing protein